MRYTRLLLWFALGVASGVAFAAVPEEEAAKLKTTLTPMGAERAATADGAIPAWDGGYTTLFPGAVPGAARIDPFAAERPLISISAKNMAEYRAKLSQGTQELLVRFPSTYRIDVYPAHRTAAAPPWVYQNNAKNVLAGRLIGSSAGLIPQSVYGGIPFPLPSSGAEVIWNHMLRWRGGAVVSDIANYMVTSNGQRVLVTGGIAESQQPYYFEEGTADGFDGEYNVLRLQSEAPPSRSGEVFLEWDRLNPDESLFWVYVPGQRRVRKLTNACCDMPLPSAAGVINFDEPDVWNGRIDQYDWKLVGKQEIFVPYNANRTQQVGLDELLLAHHLNPDHVRWELHRVWVVEAVLAAGKTNAAAKGRYYVDEDTWTAVLADRWDASGRIIKTLWALPVLMPEFPVVTAQITGGHDLLAGTWVAMGVSNGRARAYKPVPRFPGLRFTPDALAGEGVR
jgi:hypothetical protein